MPKPNQKWVALCSAAIGAVYAAGYFATESQVATAAQAAQPPAAIADSAQAAQTARLYKDGTYYGAGMNRRGSIQVAVTIAGDKITDVEITDFAMHYSERDVVGMPEEVVQIQSAQVNNVSGATYSTMAFQDAVQEALSRALLKK